MSQNDLQQKPIGQTASAGFQVGIRRTIPLPKELVWAFITSAEGLKLWLGEVASLDLQAGHMFKTKEGTAGELRVLKLFQQLRMTWQKESWEKASTLQIRLISTSSDKTTLSFHQEKLKDEFVRAEMLLHWEQAINKIIEGIK